MTHSLHRRGTRESLSNDFVVLGCPATGVNKKGSAPKTQKFLSICYKHGPINLGDMKTGNIYNTTMDDILKRVTDGTIVECTFDNREKIVSLLKELKDDRPGISVIISGVTDVVQQCMTEAGMGRIHSLEYSLGTWGNTEPAARFRDPPDGHHVRSRDDRLGPGPQDGQGRETGTADDRGVLHRNGGMLFLRQLQCDPGKAALQGAAPPVYGP